MLIRRSATVECCSRVSNRSLAIHAEEDLAIKFGPVTASTRSVLIVLFYRFLEEKIEIVRILHQRMDFERHL
jgi:hypothetical protein